MGAHFLERSCSPTTAAASKQWIHRGGSCVPSIFAAGVLGNSSRVTSHAQRLVLPRLEITRARLSRRCESKTACATSCSGSSEVGQNFSRPYRHAVAKHKDQTFFGWSCYSSLSQFLSAARRSDWRTVCRQSFLQWPRDKDKGPCLARNCAPLPYQLGGKWNAGLPAGLPLWQRQPSRVSPVQTCRLSSVAQNFPVGKTPCSFQRGPSANISGHAPASTLWKAKNNQGTPQMSACANCTCVTRLVTEPEGWESQGATRETRTDVSRAAGQGRQGLKDGKQEEDGDDSVSSGPEPSYSPTHWGYFLQECRRSMTTSYGGVLDRVDIAYETWGRLNESRSNAVLLTCGLSASSHARSSPLNEQPGWWENFIGPGLALDTNKFFVICVANFGGCSGTSGPSSISGPPQENGKPSRYGLSFPMFSIRDMVRIVFRVLDHLGIETLHAVVGSSLGGMQSLTAAAMHPERVRRLVSISGAAASSPLSIALRYAQRQVLMADPLFNNGEYYDSAYPCTGMKLAREIATITYRSGPEWEKRFGRQRVHHSGCRQRLNSGDESESTAYWPPTLGPDFTVEAYLEHQGKKWCNLFDPNSMILISKAMDHFSLEERDESTGQLSLEYGLRRVLMPALVIGVKSDILFPLWQQKLMAHTLKQTGNDSVAFYTLDSIYGHDTFLIDFANVGAAIKGHLEQTHQPW
ncbi:homoserine o-acetyltransferase [Cystoisospora suis]|uniref:Homoserine o-acetyltransferase n=1 Tax=Cystoisospora suis TaxID=483139 RepID=A0A2C6L3U5_9APIC|nr:homoserine o-acetyltransferase [Cystoisospora suis]